MWSSSFLYTLPRIADLFSYHSLCHIIRCCLKNDMSMALLSSSTETVCVAELANAPLGGRLVCSLVHIGGAVMGLRAIAILLACKAGYPAALARHLRTCWNLEKHRAVATSMSAPLVLSSVPRSRELRMIVGNMLQELDVTKDAWKVAVRQADSGYLRDCQRCRAKLEPASWNFLSHANNPVYKNSLSSANTASNSTNLQPRTQSAPWLTTQQIRRCTYSASS